MAIKPETIRDLAAASPFLMSIDDGFPAHREHVRRMDKAGMMETLTNGRVFDEAGVEDMMEGVDPARKPAVKERDFYEGATPGRYFLTADIRRTADASRAADAAISRIAKEDPDAAHNFQLLLEAHGSRALFEQFATEARRHDLAQVAQASRPDEDLATPEQAMARRSRGRVM